VNYPDCDEAYIGKKRICVHHKNIPNVMAKLTAEVANKGINIDNMLNRSKGAYAYTVIDIDEGELDGAEARLRAVEGVIRVRVI